MKPQKPQPIAMTPLESSMVSGYHYDPQTRALTIQYKGKDAKPGAIHRYDDVSIEKVEALSGAASPGRYFNDKIKGLHTSTKIEPEK